MPKMKNRFNMGEFEKKKKKNLKKKSQSRNFRVFSGVFFENFRRFC